MNRIRRWTTALSALLLLAISASTFYWATRYIEKQMRADILLQTEMTAQGIDIRRLITLTGTSADLTSENYLRLKEQITKIREANPRCRFIYLLGQRPDGKLFFFADSESPTSSDYSPPGQVYEEATEDDFLVFSTKKATAEGGPYRDRWGVWISTSVPILNPRTQEVLAVLGMDFDATYWYHEVAGKTALQVTPIVIALFLAFFLVLLSLSNRTIKKHQEALLRTEKELELSENRFRTFLDSTPDRVYLKDEKNQLVFVNRAQLSAIGKEESEIIGETVDASLGVVTACLHSGVESQTIDSDKIRITEEHLNDSVLESLSFPVGLGDGKVGFGCIVRDITVRRKAEEAARQLSDTINKATVGVTLSSTDGSLTYVNDALCDTYGYTREELIGKSSALLGVGESEAAQITAALARDGKWSGDVRQRRKDGSLFPAFLSAFLIRRENNDERVIVSFIQDITDLKQVEETLRESEERYRLVVDNIIDVVVVMDLDLVPVFVSPAVAKWTGYTPEEVISKGLGGLLTPESYRTVMEFNQTEFAKASESPDIAARFELEVIRKDGVVISCEASSRYLRQPDNTPQAIISIVRDITESKRISSHLLQNARLNEALLSLYQKTPESTEDFFRSAIDTAVNLTNSKLGFIGLVDENESKMFSYFFSGQAMQECATKGAVFEFDIRTGGYWAEAARQHRTVLVNDFSLPSPLKKGVPEGHVTLHRFLGVPVVRNGRTVLVAGLADKMTSYDEHETNLTKVFFEGVWELYTKYKAADDQVKLEEQLRQSQKMESIGRLAGGVAHDFNNILQSVIGFSEILQSNLGPGDSNTRYVEEIINASETAAALTKQLLAFSRKQVIVPQVMDLNEVIARSKKMLKRLIREDIECIFIPALDLWKVRVDSAQIDQILINLVVNSKDAIENDGKLTIETANKTFDEEFCRNHIGAAPGKYVMMAVSDTGHGMPREIIDKIFEPFFTTKDMGKGTGLGLAMVYGIIKQHGGFISVYSEVDHGTSIRIYLPAHSDEIMKEEEPSIQELPLGNETVLLVEDQEMVRRLGKHFLEQCGYKVIDAEDGLDALEKSDRYEGEIHLLITDVVMPNMGGKKLHEELVEKRRGTKVLYISGYTDNAITHQGMIETGTQFLSKPFKMREFLMKVRETLGQESRETENFPAESNFDSGTVD